MFGDMQLCYLQLLDYFYIQVSVNFHLCIINSFNDIWILWISSYINHDTFFEFSIEPYCLLCLSARVGVCGLYLLCIYTRQNYILYLFCRRSV